VVAAGPRNAVAEPLTANTTLFGVGQNSEPLLFEPKGVAVGPDGKIYVTEGRANRVTVFNQDGTIANSWGRSGPAEGEFNEPWAVAVGPAGQVFIANTWNHRIEKFSPDGRLLTSWGGLADSSRDVQGAPGKFWGPRSIAIGPDNLLYVTDTGNKRIQVFDLDGNFERAFGGAGSEPGQFNEPVGLAFDGDTLVVTDAWNNRIQRLDKSGAPLTSIPIQGWESHGIANKPYIAVGPDHRTYVTLPERGEVLQVDPDGKVTPLARPSDAAGRIGLPTGLVVDQNNVLYIAESGGGALTRMQLGANP
jgi:DNA-binding beta-propeller fold protein YncE